MVLEFQVKLFGFRRFGSMGFQADVPTAWTTLFCPMEFQAVGMVLCDIALMKSLV